MKTSQIFELINNTCPEMNTNSNFVRTVIKKYSKDSFIEDVRPLSIEESRIFYKLEKVIEYEKTHTK